MSIRLNKVTKECNVGLQTAVEFLQKKGFDDVKADPNTKITDEQYQLLVAEFKTDKGLRNDADVIIRKRQQKEKKETISIPEEKPVLQQTEAKLERRPKIVGHMDLDALKRKPARPTEHQEKPEPAPVAQEPKNEVPAEEPQQPVSKPEVQTVPEQVASTTPAQPEETKPQAEKQPAENTGIGTEENGVFRLNNTAQALPQLKVKGHIDLDSLNQQTRPKKKTREERRKEREEKNRQGGTTANAQKGGAMQGGAESSDGKKRRISIVKERVN